MFVYTPTDNRLIPETRDGVTAEDDGKNEGDPPANQDASCDDGNDGKTSDRKKPMIEDKQGQSGGGYCASKDDLDCPIVEQEFLDMVQAQHQLVLPKSIVNCHNFIDVQSIGQDQSNQDEKVVCSVGSSR